MKRIEAISSCMFGIILNVFSEKEKSREYLNAGVTSILNNEKFLCHEKKFYKKAAELLNDEQ